MLVFVIQPEEADQTIISFLKKRFKTTPLTLIYKLFRTKKIKVDEKNVRYYHHRLKTGEKISIYDTSLKLSQPNSPPLPENPEIEPKIIYEDQNIIIVLKEHGLSMPELDKAVQYYFYRQNPQRYQELTQKYFSFVAIHRLDKLTQGLVIYPKNPAAKRILYNAINDKEKITKKYLAICENSPKKTLPNYVSGYLWKNEPEQKMEFSPNQEKENAKHCAMEIRIIAGDQIKEISRENNRLLLEITLHTGRKHQIRSVLSYFGLPVIGDKKYNSKIIMKDKIKLFAYKIIFVDLPAPLAYLNGKEIRVKQ